MSEKPKQIQQRDAAELAAGYTPVMRAIEIASIVIFIAIELYLFIKLGRHFEQNPWLLLSAAIAGYLFADFISGFVHWLADTWGSVDMPIIGKALLRPFREHHVDPKAITRHDFIETNGMNCGISIPGVGIVALMPLDNPWSLFFVAMITTAALWVMGTNQFHKWSHQEPEELPGWVKLLQRLHIVLPIEHHDIHHTPPFNKHYCITSGVLNRPLAAIRFFPTLERMVTAVTGILPRADDIGVEAAKEVFVAEVVGADGKPVDPAKKDAKTGAAA